MRFEASRLRQAKNALQIATSDEQARLQGPRWSREGPARLFNVTMLCVAVATSREDHRSPRSGRAVPHRRWGRERKRSGRRSPDTAGTAYNDCNLARRRLCASLRGEPSYSALTPSHVPAPRRADQARGSCSLPSRRRSARMRPSFHPTDRGNMDAKTIRALVWLAALSLLCAPLPGLWITLFSARSFLRSGQSLFSAPQPQGPGADARHGQTKRTMRYGSLCAHRHHRICIGCSKLFR